MKIPCDTWVETGLSRIFVFKNIQCRAVQKTIVLVAALGSELYVAAKTG